MIDGLVTAPGATSMIGKVPPDNRAKQGMAVSACHVGATGTREQPSW